MHKTDIIRRIWQARYEAASKCRKWLILGFMEAKDRESAWRSRLVQRRHRLQRERRAKSSDNRNCRSSQRWKIKSHQFSYGEKSGKYFTNHPQQNFVYFRPFSNKLYIKLMWKCPSNMQCWDLNPWPSEHESPLITTRLVIEKVETISIRKSSIYRA